ncbi:MAG: helix-turn-helix transcriptional regulator [Lachnospiraceae bacterium]|nr:helix-turn-helix transcriptional regulator [Lachnospiraceae bacterium]
MDQQKMGAFLKKLRNEKNLTQEQLAEKFGVSRRSVSRWEGGHNLPDIDILLEMSDFYEVELKELLNGERKNEQMENKEKEMALMVTDYNIEKNMTDAKIAIGFFIAGLLGAVVSILLRNVDLGRTFMAGLLVGIIEGIGPGAMVVGLFYAYRNFKSLRETKDRLLNR